MPLVGSFVLPHGALLLDEAKPAYSAELNRAMRQAACDLVALRPDVVLLSTPHGIALDSDFGLYLNLRAKGSAEWLGEWSEYAVSVQLDRTMTVELRDALKDQGIGVSGVSSFASTSVEAPLRWGEAVPLWFIEEALQQGAREEEGEQRAKPSYVILSQPARRMVDPAKMVPELRRMGESVSAFFEERSERAVIVISGDLAHTHSSSTDAPYPHSESAAPFDQALEEWASSLDEAALARSSELVGEALCCGYTGFVLLDAALRHQQRSLGKTLVPRLYERQTPTYYGMLVASFLPS